jgi:hypothetical protein
VKGRKGEFTVERLGSLTRRDLHDEVQRVADLHGASEPALVVE